MIELGHDPNDIKGAKKLIKKNNEDIDALIKQLNLPHSKHPQTKEILESQTYQEEMMDLVLQLNDQLKEMEKDLDNLIQLKQASLETATATVIPIVTTIVPSTLVASLAPTTPLATTLPTSTTSTLATTQLGDEASKLVKAMEDMSIQTTEINKIKEKITSLENDSKLHRLCTKRKYKSQPG